MKKLVIGLLLIALLAGGAVFSGLANPLIERQVAGALVQSGIGERRAQCMAARMVDRLSIVQLWQLRQAMAPLEGEPGEAYGLGELVKRLRRVGDGETVAVLTTSAGLCALGIG
ncbi:hypothetical protein [Porphyrobacter sp. AAP60]|uniref:hypothetical protein n=1 Tax=Porphyrobacter sp. AAP60 TaxID=1523423 RepID=UPI0006B9DA11|nr:hypothetical protein [Porphyrobacter sp. AAP60]KPF64775.1 hypothetical protein IP79_00590 [Porphyrobacter sp. AAP60]